MKDERAKPYVVGLGASAGGLEALEEFFQSCQPDSGLTYVVIQHLSPDFKSLMAELLSRHTTMTIQRVDTITTIRPNTVYLIPPKKNLRIKGHELIPTDQDPNIGIRLPIDTFLFSLAEEYGSHAIGVILSGTGSDGTRGAGAIKENEGLIIAQEPTTCKFDGMPQSVIKHGIPDRVVPPSQIPTLIQKYAEYPAARGETFDLEKEPTKLQTICSLLQSIEGVDFSNYRPTTISRRIERRIKVNHLENLGQYIELIRRNTTELKELHGELLIGVTRFFRDKEAFDFFRQQVVPEIIARSQEDEILRVWVAGCSTGEEAYTIAICLLEGLQDAKVIKDIKIFATDVDREALEFASLGRYPESILEDIGISRINQFFVKHEHGYQVRSKLRRSIVFSHHNCVKDPPFTKLHLISCRNMLIYFKNILQERALSLFHFGLKNNGVLFLGKSEALGDLAQEFSAINPSHKMFQKLRDIKLTRTTELGPARKIIRQPAYLDHDKSETSFSHFAKEPRLNFIYEKLLIEFVPPSIIISEAFQLLHTFGDAGRFLQIPSGKSTFNVLKMLDKDLSIALSTAISRATKTGKDVRFKEIKKTANPTKKYDILVKPFLGTHGQGGHCFAVLFDEAPISGGDATSNTSEVYNAQVHAQEQITNLEDQLMSSRESLQSTIEELETTNEELQSTNEELMSSNEELQSSNEELQSVNEELYTVNAEHQSKIDELTQANNDIDFLLESSNIAIMFLDKSLRIRLFNKSVQRIINVIPQDIGRPITDLTFNFANKNIVKFIKQVAATGQNISEEISGTQGRYLLKIVTYAATTTLASQQGFDKPPQGVVLSFLDISPLKLAEDLRQFNLDAEEFNYVVSHDLNKPIRELQSTASQIEKASATDPIDKTTIQQQAVAITEVCQGLKAMLDAILVYSRIRTHGETFTNFVPSKIIKDAVISVEKDLPYGRIEVGSLPTRAFGCPKQITDVCKYLMLNSIQHNRDTQDLKIKIWGTSSDDSVTFFVSDNGRGFQGLPADNMFMFFAKGNPSHDGLGVGLAFAKRIVKRHQGEIWIDNAEAGHATIAFSLPPNPNDPHQLEFD